MASPQQPAPLPTALQAPSKPLCWSKIIELGYSDPPVPSDYCCFHCGSPGAAVEEHHGKNTNLLKCSQCKVASYCSKEHQVLDWKQGGHKAACTTYARVGATLHLKSLADQQAARDEIFGRVRFYAGPYAVHKLEQLGRGFLFVQTDRTLACMSLAIPKDCCGRPTGMRSILVHYLTLGEYDQEVCRDDFEMAAVRSDLHHAVDLYNEQEEAVVLMRFRCGHVALGMAPLSSNYTLCRDLGHSYFADSSAGALQLNLDDL